MGCDSKTGLGLAKETTDGQANESDTNSDEGPGISGTTNSIVEAVGVAGKVITTGLGIIGGAIKNFIPGTGTLGGI